MTPPTSPRTQRRRSSCPSFFWILVLAWAVLMAGSNVAQILMLPEFFVRSPPREEVVKEPNYYEILGVTPLVDDEILRQMRRKHLLEFHPDKGDDDPEATKTFINLHEVFETLTDGRRRCEYDKAHKIKGRWPFQTCHDAFRKEYTHIVRELYEKGKQELGKMKKGSPSNEESDGPESSGPGDEPTSPTLKVRPLKPSGRRSDSNKASRLRSENKRPTSPGTQAGPAVTVVMVEADPEAKDAVETVTSAVGEVLGGVAALLVQAWGYVCHYSWEVLSGFHKLMGILRPVWVFEG